MIKYAIARWCAGIERTARVATRLGKDAITLATFPCVEVTTRTARRDRLGGEWTRSDADPAEFGNASLRFSRFSFIGADQTLDAS
jgi:hypothetical protein